MNGRWRRNGIETELFKKGHDNIRFDRMIPSGSPWLMPIQKLRYMMGHTGKHLINPTTKYLGIQITGKLNPCQHFAKEKSDKPTYQKIPKISKQKTLEKEFLLTLVQ